jgi:hypothetical protein
MWYAEDGMELGKAVRTHIYRTSLPKESQKSGKPVTQR